MEMERARWKLFFGLSLTPVMVTSLIRIPFPPPRTSMLRRFRLPSSSLFTRHSQQRVRTLASSVPPIRDATVDNLASILGSEAIEQTQNDIPATPPTSRAYPQPQPPKPSSAHSLPSSSLSSSNAFQLYVKASPNNTIITFSTPTGRVLSVISAGMCGFKKVQRSSYEAGYRCAVRVFEKIAEVGEDNIGMTLHVHFKGFGQGREAVYRALTTSEGDAIRDMVKCLSDRTPIKIGGTKAKKTRRL